MGTVGKEVRNERRSCGARDRKRNTVQVDGRMSTRTTSSAKTKRTGRRKPTQQVWARVVPQLLTRAQRFRKLLSTRSRAWTPPLANAAFLCYWDKPRQACLAGWRSGAQVESTEELRRDSSSHPLLRGATLSLRVVRLCDFQEVPSSLCPALRVKASRPPGSGIPNTGLLVWLRGFSVYTVPFTLSSPQPQIPNPPPAPTFSLF